MRAAVGWTWMELDGMIGIRHDFVHDASLLPSSSFRENLPRGGRNTAVSLVVDRFVARGSLHFFTVGILYWYSVLSGTH